MIPRTLTTAAIFGGLALLSLPLLVWLIQDLGPVRWRLDIVSLKLMGAVPQEGWTRIWGRIAPGPFEGSPSGFALLDITNVPSEPASIAAGSELFKAHCSSCHGVDGTGGTFATDLTDPILQSITNAEMFVSVQKGKTGTDMPPSPVDAWETMRLIGYVRSIASKSARSTEARTAQACDTCTDINVSTEDIHASGAGELWLSYAGDYSGRRFSSLDQINTTNVTRLRPRFVHQMKSLIGLEAEPIVVGGRMFLTGMANEVVALEVATGKQLWSYRRAVASGLSLCCGRPNRGVAVMGNRIFHGTLDAHLIALDSDTGQQLWDSVVADPEDGYTITAAPLALGGRIIVGVGGGDYGSRGFVAAYEASTGEQLWRFYTVPEPGQTGSETWPGDTWKNGGGGTWVTGAYDPELDLVYWGVGNPAPTFNPMARQGDNLYTSSVIALDASTGELRWHFQFTPNDGHDWDAGQPPVLVDAEYKGALRQLLLFANRNCFYYVLDRVTGEFLSATEYCTQSWNDGFTHEGRPILREGAVPTPGGAPVSPGLAGGASWYPPAYNPTTGLFYVSYMDRVDTYYSDQSGFSPPAPYDGGKVVNGTAQSATLKALDAKTGETVWEGKRQINGYQRCVMTTAGGLVFSGNNEGRLLARDAASGEVLWEYRLGAAIRMAPVTYMRQNGSQELAVIAGGALFVMELTD